MKRFLILLLAVTFCFIGVQAAFSDTQQPLKRFVVTNDTDVSKTVTLCSVTTYVNTNTFLVGTDKLMGFELTSTGPGGLTGATAISAYFAFYDSAAITDTPVNKLEAEIEVGATQTSASVSWPRGYYPVNGIVLIVGPRSCVTIVYEWAPSAYGN